MVFEKTYISPNIIHLKFESKAELGKHLLRFQEHFESPKFRGKIFNLSEYKSWYKEYTKRSKFTYYEDWSGFNFPSRILEPFFDGDFDPLSSREKAIIKVLSGQEEKFYVIGTYNDDSLTHEIAHALFYTNLSYRKEIKDVLDSFDCSIFTERFKEMGGYHPSVFIDETHAYLLSNKAYLKRRLKINYSNVKETSNKIKAIFKRYNPS